MISAVVEWSRKGALTDILRKKKKSRPAGRGFVGKCSAHGAKRSRAKRVPNLFSLPISVESPENKISKIKRD